MTQNRNAYIAMQSNSNPKNKIMEDTSIFSQLIGQANRLNDTLMSRKELCDYLGISTTTLWRYEKRDDFPPRIKLSFSKHYYWKKDVLEFLETLKKGEAA